MEHSCCLSLCQLSSCIWPRSCTEGSSCQWLSKREECSQGSFRHFLPSGFYHTPWSCSLNALGWDLALWMQWGCVCSAHGEMGPLIKQSHWTEYPELEGTHKDQQSPAALDSPKNPTPCLRALSERCHFLGSCMVLWGKGANDDSGGCFTASLLLIRWSSQCSLWKKDFFWSSSSLSPWELSTCCHPTGVGRVPLPAWGSRGDS